MSLAAASAVLASIPSPDRGVWYLGPVPIRAYALCIIAGIVIAVLWGERRFVARGGEPGTVTDVAVYAVPFGLVGGRLYHVLTDWESYFGPGRDPWDAVKIWQGGLGIWGAVALGAVGAWIGCRRRGVPLPFFADAVAPGIVTAQAVGRLGNWFNQELYGAPTTLPWGLEIYRRVDPATGVPDGLGGVALDHTPVEIVQPTFLYELLWNLVVAGLVVWADRRFRLGHGRAFAVYVAGYTAGRFFIEQLRTDYATRVFGDIRINVVVAAVLFLGALLYIALAPRGRETLPGAAERPAAEEAGVLAAVPAGSAAVAEEAGGSTGAGSTATVSAASTSVLDDGTRAGKPAPAGPGPAPGRSGGPPSDANPAPGSVAVGPGANGDRQPRPPAAGEPDRTQDPAPEGAQASADRSEPRPGAEPGSAAEPRPGAEPGSAAVAEPDQVAEPEPTAEPQPVVEPQPKAEAERTAEPTAGPEPVAEPQPKAEAERTAEPAVGPEPVAEAVPTAAPESPAEPQQVAESRPSAEAERTAEPTAAPASAAASPPAVEPERGPTSTPGTDRDPGRGVEADSAVRSEPSANTPEPVAEHGSGSAAASASEPEPVADDPKTNPVAEPTGTRDSATAHDGRAGA